MSPQMNMRMFAANWLILHSTTTESLIAVLILCFETANDKFQILPLAPH